MKKFKFAIDGNKFETTVNELDNNQFEIEVNGSKYTVEVEREAAPAAPKTTPGKVNAISNPTSTSAGTVATTKAPLPGSIVKVLASEGQKIAKGDTVLTMESMKMENEIKAECSGVVVKLHVSAGQNVMQDDKLFDIKAEGLTAPAPAAASVAAPAAKPAAAPAAGAKAVKAPLPGSIVKIVVKEGDAVKRGDTLLTMESMKMENEIKAEFDGTVTAIKVAAGQNVMQDDDLVVLG